MSEWDQGLGTDHKAMAKVILDLQGAGRSRPTFPSNQLNHLKYKQKKGTDCFGIVFQH